VVVTFQVKPGLDPARSTLQEGGEGEDNDTYGDGKTQNTLDTATLMFPPGLDHLFTLSKRVGGWCMVSTHLGETGSPLSSGLAYPQDLAFPELASISHL